MKMEPSPMDRTTTTTTWWPWSSSRTMTSNVAVPLPLWHFHHVLATRPRFLPEVKKYALAVAHVDLRHEDNAEEHRTSNYELMSDHKALVIRRGGVVNIHLNFEQRSFDPNRDQLHLVLLFGSRGSVSKGTKAVVPLSTSWSGDPMSWRARRRSQLQRKLEVELQVPVLVPVGLWHLSIVTLYNDERNVFDVEQPVYILFNPYHVGKFIDDNVYVKDASLLDNYLIKDTGLVYGGTHARVEGRPWVFGQYRDTVLPAVCHIMDKLGSMDHRADPVRVSRSISALVNSSDEAGVLVGRWDGDYVDGKKPFEWTGSVAIIEQFVATGTPVKYGQCWVFAGVVTTMCRALGLPARCVTNYLSAHDANGNLSIEKFVDVTGDVAVVDEVVVNNDSIWNFHVWNEVYMQRKDLPQGFGGWQVIDATPQETSDNVYRCGPASVESIRRGEIGLGFDSQFVFAEVNADIFVFVKNDDDDHPETQQPFTLAQTNTDHVGRRLVTEGPGSLPIELTSCYKASEGSISERLSYMRASSLIGAPHRLLEKFRGSDNDVFMQTMDVTETIYGQPFTLGIFLHNQSGESRSLRVRMSSVSMFYTGQRAHVVRRGEGDFVLRPHERETLSMVIEPEVYMPKTVEYCQFNSHFIVKVRETGQIWSGHDDFALIKPQLKVHLRASAVNQGVRINRPCTLTVSLTNPLDTKLTQCHFDIEAPGITDAIRRYRRVIEAHEEVEVRMELVPRKSGKTSVVATFNALELFNVTGIANVNVLT